MNYLSSDHVDHVIHKVLSRARLTSEVYFYRSESEIT